MIGEGVDQRNGRDREDGAHADQYDAVGIVLIILLRVDADVDADGRKGCQQADIDEHISGNLFGPDIGLVEAITEHDLIEHDRDHKDHQDANDLPDDKKSRCYTNQPHCFPVKTRQEVAIRIDRIKSISFEGKTINCEYE